MKRNTAMARDVSAQGLRGWAECQRWTG